MFNAAKFKALAEVLTAEDPCISIFVPTHRAGQNQEDRLRFKNALLEATDKLKEGKIFIKNEMDKKAAKDFLSKGFELLEDKEFWLHLSDGLAVFIGPDHFEYHLVPIRFNPLVYVGKHYYLRPMLPLLTGEDRFFLLALSQNELRFFEGHQYHITPVRIADLVPEDAAEALKYWEVEESIQHHSGKGSGETAIFHGHAAHKDQKLDQLKDYFRQIDKGLMQMLHDESAPLIIASVDYLVPIYREISSYSNIVDVQISGNPDHDDPVLLHEKAWDKLKDHFAAEKEKKKEKFLEYMSQDKASFSVLDIVEAAAEGKIDSLFVDKNSDFLWGYHKQITGHRAVLEEEQNAYNTCLLNYAAIKTYLNGGQVYNVPRTEFPQGTAQMNAIYRY